MCIISFDFIPKKKNVMKNQILHKQFYHFIYYERHLIENLEFVQLYMYNI